jgi:hypothetical protein
VTEAQAIKAGDIAALAEKLEAGKLASRPMPQQLAEAVGRAREWDRRWERVTWGGLPTPSQFARALLVADADLGRALYVLKRVARYRCRCAALTHAPCVACEAKNVLVLIGEGR